MKPGMTKETHRSQDNANLGQRGETGHIDVRNR
jgi:hypothetical protein